MSGASLLLPARRLTAIVGPSGSGKSTLLRLCSGELKPSTGRLAVDGCELETVLERYRTAMATVPQNPPFISAPLRENLRLGEAVRDSVLLAALASSGAGFVDGREVGLGSTIGGSGRSLSTGRLQRVAIARAISRRPSVLLLDEPTSALDPETELALIQSVRELSRLQTTIVATHFLPLMLAADCIVVVVDGRITACGSPREVMAAGTYFTRVMRMHALEAA